MNIKLQREKGNQRMDNYTKMCDCPEIRDLWEPKVGDKAKLKFYRIGFIGFVVSVHEASQLLIDLEQGYGNQYQHELIWLPTIEQLMGMADLPNYEDVDKMGKLVVQYAKSKKSAQELWLAFVMSELHGKKWKEEEWI